MAEKQGSFDLILDKNVKGESDLKNARCHFHYHWDAETNTGIGMLQSINDTAVNIVLHPLGIAGTLDFMSDMEPTHFQVNSACDESIALLDIVIYRVILDMDPETGEKEAAIMFKMDGSTIQTTASFSEGSAAKSLPPVTL
jgi:hypothetical protein